MVKGFKKYLCKINYNKFRKNLLDNFFREELEFEYKGKSLMEPIETYTGGMQLRIGGWCNLTDTTYHKVIYKIMFYRTGTVCVIAEVVIDSTENIESEIRRYLNKWCNRILKVLDLYNMIIR